MTENNRLNYLRQKLASKHNRVAKRYKFYEMKNHVQDFGISTPPQLRAMPYVLGWAAKACDSLADRIVFDEYRNDHADMMSIAMMNNPDVYFDSAILESIIASCSFTYISADGDGFPRWQVITAEDATGILDPMTGLLKEGYAVLERGDLGEPIIEAHFMPFRTDYYNKGKLESMYEHAAPYALLVPHINRPDSKRPFGHSQISRAGMNLIESAVRTVKRSEITAEFYSFPQKFIIGTSEELDLDTWSSAMSAMMNISKDEDGDRPTVGQFAQQSMTPHLDQFKMFASAFAGETGLTLDDLGFPTANPSSADAIRSQHENLRLRARKAQRSFGSSFLNVGFLSACIRDNITYERKAFANTSCAWLPIFEPDSAMLSSIGDGVIKLNQGLDGYITEERLKDLTGIK